ncbi:TadE family protein [Pirellula staleyi DSM 6068]|uniref:TadE family protein n=1 Tax=Pirellula staleyi (strain ATCC 27377 / DSM 6068 / ICPB 4128) TaxID=530564 RepID=D2R671_PIRSD|nr:TadE/TadG family type IV pilus assembly protein [Pirellula staleyi]ADB19156.1 TadE family protein [Pirellula staleyi DSM 6068]
MFQQFLANRSSSKRTTRARSAAVTVEFALTIPLLFLLFFGMIEFARIAMIENSVENAAYEGARAAIVPGGTSTSAQTAAQSALSAAMISGATVSVTPSNITIATTSVTVDVSVPLNSNTWVLAAFTSGRFVNRSCKLNREKTSSL